jgi:GABA permease
MINPLRSEEDAFRFTLIVAALLAPIALVAVIWSTGAALAVAGGLALGLVMGLFVLRREEPRPKAELRPRQEDGSHRILVVANETLSGRALRSEISGRSHGARTELRVVCPALNTKLRHWTNEEDQARADAAERLQGLLARLRGEGFEAEGDIGDDDPVQAMEDALRRFPAHEVIISTHPAGRSNWLEHDVVDRARDRFDLPVTHVVVDLEQERAGAGARPPVT